jgi:hypothetical protein
MASGLVEILDIHGVQQENPKRTLFRRAKYSVEFMVELKIKKKKGSSRETQREMTTWNPQPCW